MNKEIELRITDLFYKERKKLFRGISEYYDKPYKYYSPFFKMRFDKNSNLSVEYKTYRENDNCFLYKNYEDKTQFFDIKLNLCIDDFYRFLLRNNKSWFKLLIEDYLKDNTFNTKCIPILIKEHRLQIRKVILDFYLKDKVKIVFNGEDVTHYLFEL